MSHITSALGRCGVFACLLLGAICFNASAANAQTKSLKLYYLHTGEKAEIIFKRNGRFDPAGLKKINWFLRDWRRNEPTKMDPNLLDLVWEAYRQSGSKQYINVISGYRSPASNSMLRKRGRGVAKNSQHTLGKAMDFFLPDVKLAKLREIGLKLQVGGVGYYPTSGSPFVHLDVGNVRHWPRMSRSELVRVFPNGDTIHVPTDGKPLARYEQALASYNLRASTGKLVPGGGGSAAKKGLTFFQRLAGMKEEEETDDGESNSAPAPKAVATKKVEPKTPEPVEPAPEVVVASVEAPKPAEIIETPEFAALPSRVPVPIIAPRKPQLDAGAAIEVAALSPAVAAETVTPSVEANAETVTEKIEEGPLSGLKVPVPAKRPDYSAPVLVASTEQNPLLKNDSENGLEQSKTSELALAATSTESSTDRKNRPLTVAALTPEEIQDLRSRAMKNVTAVPTPNPTDRTLASSSQALRPTASDNAQTASLSIAPADDSSSQKSDQPKLILASLPVPSPNPKRKTAELAQIEKSSRVTKQSAVLSIKEVAEPKPVKVENAKGKTLAKRTISLDKLSAPEDNSNTIGTWALSNEQTISTMANFQPPAYGRNMIRQIPDTIVVQKFDSPTNDAALNSFQGKAVNAMKFAKIRLN